MSYYKHDTLKPFKENQMCSLMAKGTGLKTWQAKLFFDVYSELLTKILENEYLPNKFVFQLWGIGYFYVVRKEGKKKGDTINLPIVRGKSETRLFVFEEDQPDYYVLKFKVLPQVQKRLREMSEVYLRERDKEQCQNQKKDKTKT